jgi:formylmethanofuran dehydrogenase subunit E
LDDFDYFVRKVNDFHGHICTGIVLGTRMTLAAMRYLAVDPYQSKEQRRLIAYTEIDRCMTDAVIVITGCSPGRRSLKLVDYGKFALTLINQDTGKAVRATVKENFTRSDDMEATKRIIAGIPDERLIALQPVQVSISKYDLPGFPVKSATCSGCGENIMDGRDIDRNGVILCRACAGAPYYQKIIG